MTNLEAKTTYELNALALAINVELKLREMIETKETKKLDLKAADISDGVFINPFYDKHSLVNRVAIGKIAISLEKMVPSNEISKGDILEFMSENDINYIVIQGISRSEIQYREFKTLADAIDAKIIIFAPQKDMPDAIGITKNDRDQIRVINFNISCVAGAINQSSEPDFSLNNPQFVDIPNLLKEAKEAFNKLPSKVQREIDFKGKVKKAIEGTNIEFAA